MIYNLFVYEVYNKQLFAFKIVHDDACHPILNKKYKITLHNLPPLLVVAFCHLMLNKKQQNI